MKLEMSEVCSENREQQKKLRTSFKCFHQTGQGGILQGGSQHFP